MADYFQHRVARRFAGGCLAGLIGTFSLATSLCFADSPEALLTKRGLKASGWVYVVEAETTFSKQLAEAREIFKELKDSQDRLDEQQDTLAAIDELTEQSNALKAELTAWKQQPVNPNTGQQFGGYGQNPFTTPGRFGAAAGFGRNAFAPQFQNNQNAELAEQLAQAEQTLTQMNNEIGRLKSLVLGKDETRRLQDEGEKQREKLQTLTLDLRKAADAISEEYKGLRNDTAIEQALAAVGRSNGMKPKLGPSKSFQADLKTLERMERTLAGGVRVSKSSKSLRKHRSKSTASSKKTAARKAATP